ncbi:MAG: TonB-dependent receptor [Tannerellaceae bacterium]|nr:TonB-dependent receptor [Tannerellaceae bacterium]
MLVRLQSGIVIKSMMIALCLLSGTFCAMAQSNVRVRGVVTSKADNTPLIGVSIVQRGTTNGASTDLDGNYELTAPVGSELQFSYLGYTSQQVTIVAGKTVYDVSLQEDSQSLDEVVVVGYGVQKKSVVTAAISRVNSSDLDLETPTTVQNALKGKVSGVQIISNSGQPGMDAKIRIRGIGTVNDSDPLYIVDGMPSSNGINFLNPSDVESIEVLKDAASAAIYGARGANGVVLVTTKNGAKNTKAVFNYEFSYGLQNPAKKLDLMNGQEYQMIMNEMGANAGRGDNFYFPTSVATNTDWQEEMTYHDAPLINHKVSLSGGGEKNAYYASLGIVDQKGIFAKDYADYKRYNVRLNYSQTLLETSERTWLNNIVFDAKVNYSRAETFGSNVVNSEQGGIISSMNMLPPTESVYQTDPAKIAEYGTLYPNYVTASDGRVYNILGAEDVVNPIAALSVRNNQKRISQIFGANFNLDFKLLPGLSFKTTLGYDFGFSSDRSIIPVYTLNASSRNETSQVFDRKNESLTWQWENLLSYNVSLGKHNISALVGTTMMSSSYSDLYGQDFGLMEENLDKGYIDSATGPSENERIHGGASDHRLSSVFGRLSYNYDEKYLIEGIIRRDGSSNFSKKNQFAIFPSISAGWAITNESFMEDRPSWFEFAKIRASWGQNGNENIGSFLYTSMMSNLLGGWLNVSAVSGGEVHMGMKPSGYVNQDLRWETSEQTDLGIDLRFFRSLAISVDYFNKKTKDMLLWMALPMYSGYDGMNVNAGTVSNEGWEFDLSYKMRAGNVNLGFGANASYVQNTVTDQGNDREGIDNMLGGLGGQVTYRENGRPYGFFFGYVHDGIFQNQAEIDNNKYPDGTIIQPGAQPGDIRWKDLDGKNGITADDRTMIGSPNPDWTYGLTLTADWNGFDFSVFFQGVQGNEIYKLYRRPNVSFANWDRSYLERWHGEGTSNWIPRIIEADSRNTQVVSTLHVESGSYFRLKVLQLGYTLPQAITRKALINKLRLFVQGENLFTATSYSGLDPEVGTRNGYDAGTYPQARTFTIGASITF